MRNAPSNSCRTQPKDHGEYMKVFYHKMEGGNVGDDMNAALWHKLVPSLSEVASADWLIGAGTILDARLDSLPGRKVVMGTGFRPGAKRVSDANVHFAAVRGFLSAAQCGLDPEFAACDPGFLAPKAWPQSRSDSDRVAFVPHVYSERYSSISRAAEDAGFEVISPTLDIETFLSKLAGHSRVFSESLHGAIFADALRIPWARVCACSRYYERPDVADFKWNDAFSVVGLDGASINRVGLLPLKRNWSRARTLLRPLQATAETRLVRALQRRRDDSTLFQLSDEARLEEQAGKLVSRVEELTTSANVARWPTARACAGTRTRPPTLRVSCFPKRGENAYLHSFANSLERCGAIVDEFTFGQALFKRYDVVHMHWPDTHLRTHSLWRAIGKHVRLGVTCAVLRARGTRIVWMIHNIEPHEKDHWLSRALFPLWFPRACTNVMALTHKGLRLAQQAYPRLPTKPSIVIPHGHYRNVHRTVEARASARRKLGLDEHTFTFVFFGHIRPYKNVPALIEAFRKLEEPRVQLLIAGRPVRGMRAEDIRVLSEGDPRIHLHLKFIPDGDVTLYLGAADKVVIPFANVLNSGSVMLALSLNRSVLAPNLGALPELQAHVGARWLDLYQGAFGPEHLQRAMRDGATPEEHERVDLSMFDWEVIGHSALHFYRHSAAPSEAPHSSDVAALDGRSSRS
jgi:beta-1,4-mannosyltransferase